MITTVTLYDKCSVELTKEGADYLSEINTKCNSFINNTFVCPVQLPMYEEGDTFCSNLGFISEIYSNTKKLGVKEPFIDGRISLLVN